MIHSGNNIKIWDQINTVLILVTGVAPDDLKKFQKLINSYFDKKQTISYLYFYNEKKLPENVIKLGDTTYLTKSDFNLFGSLKDKSIKERILHTEHDLLLCIYFKKIKNVNKLITAKKAKYTIGVEQESLPNFDIAFIAETEDGEALTQLAVKYLKQV